MSGGQTQFSDDYRKIVLHGDPDYFERQASGTIKPGSLVAIAADGTVAVNAVANDATPNLAFALEDVLQGKTINDNYVLNDQARCAVFKSGEEVLAIAFDANVLVGSKVGSKGDGTLHLYDSGQAIGQVLHKYTDPDDENVIRIFVQIF